MIVILWNRPGGGVAPVPPAFEGGLALAQASERARADGRPVLVFATADWCGPCQALKRGALLDAGVSAAIREGFVPVYLDVDANPADAQRLNVQSIPALIVLNAGQEAARLEGAVSTPQLSKWLTERRKQ